MEEDGKAEGFCPIGQALTVVVMGIRQAATAGRYHGVGCGGTRGNGSCVCVDGRKMTGINQVVRRI